MKIYSRLILSSSQSLRFKMSETFENISRKRVFICLLLGLAFSIAKRYIVMLFYDPDEDRNFRPGKISLYVKKHRIKYSEDVVSAPHAARQ